MQEGALPSAMGASRRSAHHPGKRLHRGAPAVAASELGEVLLLAGGALFVYPLGEHLHARFRPPGSEVRDHGGADLYREAAIHEPK